MILSNENRRGFSPGERKALGRLYDGLCTHCGQPGEEADHITPYSLGGATSLKNGQWLCGDCNRRKGAKRETEDTRSRFRIAKPAFKQDGLRPWQKRCLDQQLAADKDFFVAAGVGSGKTMQALSLYLAGDYDLVIVVVPKTGIRGSWKDDATAMGIDLHAVVSGAKFHDKKFNLPHGYVLTTHMLQSVAHDMAALCEKFRTLVVYDEAHHLGEDMTWTTHADQAFQKAAFHVGLSGTPDRTDNRRIAFLNYLTHGNRSESAPCFIYSTKESVEDKHTVPVDVRLISGEVEHITKSGSTLYRYEDDYHGDKSLMGKRLQYSAVESVGWQMGAVMEARKDLEAFGPQWGGLIICKLTEQAEKIAAELEKLGDRCLCIVKDADTEESVAAFKQDTSYRWAVSITKISEGISIDRLRVGVMLTNVTTPSTFEQVRGRLARVLPGIDPQNQIATLYCPKDPRMVELAKAANEMMSHVIDWTRERGPREPREGGPPTIPIGKYVLHGTAKMDGAVRDGEFVAESQFLKDLREEMVQEKNLNPITAARANSDWLLKLKTMEVQV